MALFNRPDTVFTVVCAPNEPSVAVARYFLNELSEREMPCAGVVMNQMHPTLGDALKPESILGELTTELSGDLQATTAQQLLARLSVNHKRLLGLCAAEQELASSLQPLLDERRRMWQVPRIEGEVHDIEALGKVFDQARQVNWS
jgi:anion-transporting  ArsA/GET3 family ATPase